MFGQTSGRVSDLNRTLTAFRPLRLSQLLSNHEMSGFSRSLFTFTSSMSVLPYIVGHLCSSPTPMVDEGGPIDGTHVFAGPLLGSNSLTFRRAFVHQREYLIEYYNKVLCLPPRFMMRPVSVEGFESRQHSHVMSSITIETSTTANHRKTYMILCYKKKR